MSAALALPRARAAPRRRVPARRAPASVSRGVRLPIAPDRARRLLLWLVALAMAAALVATLLLMRVPQRIGAWAQAQSVASGFEVRAIRVTGTRHLGPATIEAAALEGGSSAMLGLSLEDVRTRLRALPWVADATVARRLPDRLDITIVERTPAALWQVNGRTQLMDATGHTLPIDDLAPWAALPLIAGPDAAREYPSLIGLLATQPAFAKSVDAATWVGGRRWDLTLKSRETLALPEGYAEAQAALAQFVALDAKQKLTGGSFTRFDLRLPGRMVVRLAHPPADPKAKAKGTAI